MGEHGEGKKLGGDRGKRGRKMGLHWKNGGKLGNNGKGRMDFNWKNGGKLGKVARELVESWDVGLQVPHAVCCVAVTKDRQQRVSSRG